MKICFITRTINKKGGQGIDNVNYNLIKEFKKTKEISLTAISSKQPLKSMFEGIIYDLSLFPTLLKQKADIYHATVPYVGYVPIILNKKRVIVTIHDLIPFFLRGMHPLSRLYYKICTKLCKRADKIITVSEYSKKEIVERIGINTDKIKVIHNGVDHNRFYPKEKEKKEFFEIGFIGGLTKQKNPLTLIKAFSKIKNKKKIKLLIGGKGKELKTLKSFVKKNKIKNVEILGFISEQKLPDFYRNLDLFVYPSLYEGFGLPVLEAMACGCPVITSNNSSLPEISGNAGILVDPTNVGDIQRKIEEVIKNRPFQKDLKKKSIEQAKKFSWENCAMKTLKIYKELVKDGLD